MIQTGLQGYQTYQRGKYETASPHRLILLLYEGAIRCGHRAVSAMERHDTSIAHQSLVKMQEIVCELLSCLNEKEGGEITRNLRAIYLYVHERLVQANVKKDPAQVREAIALLSDLQSAWEQIGKESRVERKMP